MTKIAKKLAAAQARKKNAPHLIINALAGTGKTTTLVEGLNYMRGNPFSIKPSPQQQAIWDALLPSAEAKKVAFCAFNRSIANELGKRVPKGCAAMTLHSMGNAAVRDALGKFKVDEYPAADHMSAIMDIEFRELRRKEFDLIRAVDRLLGLCKMNLTGFDPELGCLVPEEDASWPEELDALAVHHDLELNGNRSRVFELVPKVLHRCLDPTNAASISYDDMIWLPVVLNLPVTKYDLLLVDECQDLNRCQQALALRAGHRLVFCGDVHQAIYGFAGADAYSMQRLEETLTATDRGCTVLPLTVTRRCGKAIVEEARKIVPEFEAHESNSDGVIRRMTFKDSEQHAAYHGSVFPGDMLICRVNAPLVSQCFRFLKSGKRAEIQGRDVGRGLIALVNKMKADSITDLIEKITDWEHMEVEREQKKRKPSEGRIIGIQDKVACILAFTDGMATVDDVLQRIQDLFTDDKEIAAIRLSSIHKAKGLEAERVFLLEPERATVPHPMATTDWQLEQEWNLRYVAITRAINELVFVS